MCTGSCSPFLNCLTCGCRTERRSFWSDIVVSFLGALAIEGCLEYFWTADDSPEISGWVKEALVASACIAGWVTFVGTFFQILHYKLSQETPELQEQIDQPCKFYLKTTAIQSLLFIVCFAAGMGVEYLVELIEGHAEIDRHRGETVWLALPVPVLVIGAKAVTRIGLFKAGTAIKDKCCAEESAVNYQPI